MDSQLDFFAPPPTDASINVGLVQSLLQETLDEAVQEIGSGDEDRVEQTAVFDAATFELRSQMDALAAPIADSTGWLVDVGEIERNLPAPALPDASEFTQEKLAQRPGMEWLNTVDAILIAPHSNDLEQQRAQLRDFKPLLLAQAGTLSPALFPRIKNYVPEPVLAMDTETTGLDTRCRYDHDGKLIVATKLVGVTVAATAYRGYYLPVMHTGEDGVLNWQPEAILPWISDLLAECTAVFHNAAYDLEILAMNGAVITRSWPHVLDTQILSYNLDINQTTHGLKPVSARMLKRSMIEIAHLFVGFGGLKKNAYIAFEHLSASQALVYGASDSMNTKGILDHIIALPGDANPMLGQPIPVAVDHQLIDTIRDMLRTGLPINYEYLYYALKDALLRLHLIQHAIDTAAGVPVNVGSGPQLNWLLFDKFKIKPLPGMKTTKVRRKANADGSAPAQYSLDEEAMERLMKAYPEVEILRLVGLYRSLVANVSKFYSKLVTNSWVDAFLPWTRVKLNFAQTRTSTGRLASAGNDGKRRASVRRGKKKMSYVFRRGAWEAGINAQGVPAGAFRTAPARTIKALPAAAGIDLDHPYPPEVEEQFLRACAEL